MTTYTRHKVTAQSTWKKSHASIVDAWMRRNCRHVDLVRCGAGGIRSRFSTRRTVEAPTLRSSSAPGRSAPISNDSGATDSTLSSQVSLTARRRTREAFCDRPADQGVPGLDREDGIHPNGQGASPRANSQHPGESAKARGRFGAQYPYAIAAVA